ncbi:nucleoid-associated protein YejK [Halomonas vilamensis]|uniref:Nucleoid-associated protein YejK n=1 Tax=Vreelandella vilamensis TaxID=531309 RepID=A0ABU1H2W1_9GAMM|nr:nucleoid-associated protein YejK [Halomonas vilamensis]MDR5898642.1 nucleoid-associated protein YejK [Halomonas vilamensis]
MPLLQSIVHRLDPTLDGERLSVTAASEPHPQESAAMETLVGELNATYNTKPKGWGRFVDGQAQGFAHELRAYLDEAQDFAAFTQTLTERLSTALAEHLSVGGYLLFTHQQQGETQTLFLALVHQRDGIGLNAAHHAEPAAQLNTRQLTLSARINLTQWQEGEAATQYVSFLKDRGGKKLAEVIAQWLGVEEGVDAPAETRTLLKAFSDYVEKEDLEDEESREKTDALVGYANEQLRRGEPMTLDELSEVVDEKQPKAFYEHIRHADYGLAAEIPPDKRTLNQFRRFTGRAGGVSISFDSHLLGSSVEYDESADRLIIKQVPKQLKEQLKHRD